MNCNKQERGRERETGDHFIQWDLIELWKVGVKGGWECTSE